MRAWTPGNALISVSLIGRIPKRTLHMKKTAIILASALILSCAAPSSAEDLTAPSEQFKICLKEHDGDPDATSSCLVGEVERLDKVLASTFGELMKKMPERGREALRISQDAWKKMRAADETAIVESFVEPGDFAYAVNEHNLKLTSDRIRILRQMIDQIGQ